MNDIITIGLTGSIGMGKSVLSRQFKGMNIPVHDSDAVVHDLLNSHALTIEEVKKNFPSAYIHGKLDRKLLGGIIFSDKAAKAKLESILHPAVQANRADFVKNAILQGHKLVVFDIPLLFETGLYKTVDHIVCVTAPPHIQAERVLSREGMTQERFEAIRAAQWPDDRKRALAHTVIDSTRGYAATRADVKALVANLVKTPKA